MHFQEFLKIWYVEFVELLLWIYCVYEFEWYMQVEKSSLFLHIGVCLFVWLKLKEPIIGEDDVLMYFDFSKEHLSCCLCFSADNL